MFTAASDSRGAPADPAQRVDGVHDCGPALPGELVANGTVEEIHGAIMSAGCDAAAATPSNPRSLNRLVPADDLPGALDLVRDTWLQRLGVCGGIPLRRRPVLVVAAPGQSGT